MTSLPIQLPKGYTPIVSEKDVVTSGQEIARKEAKKDVLINIPDAFGVPVRQAGKLLKKNPGDSIEIGDIIAKKTGKLGFGEKKLESKINGTILRFERDSGNVVIRLNRTDNLKLITDNKVYKDRNGLEADVILSPIDGIVSMCNNSQIVIDTDKDIILGLNGFGGSVSAEWQLLPGGIDGEVELLHLDASCIGKVIIGGLFKTDVLLKAIGMEVAGVIGSEIGEEEYKYIEARHMHTPVVDLSRKDLEAITESKHKKLFMDGITKTILVLKA